MSRRGKCGCKRGYFLCPTGEKLWREYSHWYFVGHYRNAEVVRRIFDKHIAQNCG